MITGLSVKNFRGIKEGRIDNLGQTNVFIGRNNSGKSTLLDLLCFFKAPLKPRNELGEFVLESLLQRRVRRAVPTEIEFFYEYLPQNIVNFKVEFDNRSGIYFNATLNNNRWIRYDLFEQEHQVGIAKFEMPLNTVPNVESQGSSSRAEQPLDFLFEQWDRFKPGLKSTLLQIVLTDKKLRSNLTFMSNAVLIDADFVRKIEGIEAVYWADMLKRRLDKKLAKILNETYGLSIEGFSFATYRDGKSKLFSLLPEVSMHIDDYGDGFRYAFSIITIASQVHDTALLLEEPEVHQHEGAVKTLFESLNRIAIDNNLQLFISTHSIDLMKTVVRVMKDVRVFHLTLDNGNLSARSIDGSDVGLMIDLGANPLELDRPFSYIVVEGKQDRIFLDALAKKLKQKDLKELSYEVLTCPKDEQVTTVPALHQLGNPF